jgi:glycosyltransferase involved in cell wall biosynthesis
VERYGGNRPIVIANSFPLQGDPHVSREDAVPSFFWFSQTLGPGRGLEKFLEAWQLTQAPSRVVFLGESYGAYAEALITSVPADRRSAISLLPLVSPTELPSVIARHDVGLALEQAAIVNRDLTITNKILQYLNAGLAIVATGTAGQREVLSHEPEAGVLVDEADLPRYAAALESLVSSPVGLRKRQNAARRLAAERYCWERDSIKLVEIVKNALR